MVLSIDREQTASIKGRALGRKTTHSLSVLFCYLTVAALQVFYPPVYTRMNITLTVSDKRPCRPPVMHTITGAFPTLTSLKEAIYVQTEVEPRDQLLLHRDRLLFGDADICSRFNLWASPTLRLYHRLPVNQPITVAVRSPRQPVVTFGVRTHIPVGVLKQFVARKFCMAPWKQVLMALKAPMLEAEPVSSYATSPRVEISLCEYLDGRQPEPLRITVVDGDTQKEQTFVLERRDTLDVLAGHLDRAGVLGWVENPVFLFGDETPDKSRSFEDYHIDDDDTLTLLRKN